MILGIDEVGRGPWAGPLVIGAVVLGGMQIEGLTDSKKLSKKRREMLDAEIREKASGFGLGWVSAVEIDAIGLSAALRLATRRAVEQVHATYSEIVIDGTINFLDGTTKGEYVTTMKKADLLVPSVSAASIIAKVARDRYMSEQDSVYSGYKFASHVGYGTAVHRAAIEKFGVTPLHRLSFAPLAKYRVDAYSSIPRSAPPSVTRAGEDVSEDFDGEKANKSSNRSGVISTTPRSPTTKQIGDAGETEVANYLLRNGHKVIERNWKTKFCEIDIITIHKGTIYFTEVKYRKNDKQGGGFAAITATKQRQMRFAAEYYALKNNVKDCDLRLAAADVSGQPPIMLEWLALS